LQVHGSYLVQHKNALLFGPNALVGEGGGWSCAARGNGGVFLDFYRSPGYAAAYPGPKPEILRGPEALTLDVSMLRPDDVLVIDEPLFLATPLRPAEWNFWVTSMPGQIAQFHRHGAGRKFLCHTAFEWQRAFLRLAGVPDAAMLMHDPGRSYICRDVMAVEYSEVNMTISAGERTGFFELVAAKQARGTYPRKLLVAPTPHNPALQTPLETLGFARIEPKTLDFAVQIGMLAAAEQIVFHGPLAVGGSVFCQPGASVITIDTTADEAGVHAGLLASLGLRHGALFGARGADDIARAVPVIEAFFRA